FAGSDTLATSYTLSQAVKKIGKFDLLICGKQAIDGDTAQVGPGIAEWLNLPQVTFVVKIEIDGKKLKAERLLEETNEIVEAPLPCVITVVKQINEPRTTSLKGMMRAKKAEIPTWGAEQIAADKFRIGMDGSPTQVVKIFSPPPKCGGKVYHGDVDAAVATVVGAIKERKIA
ncbi:MAG: electron transfer flavoprotein subunit beta/FixA family protein, partial [Candidatus Margulisiibacteriota bacterium]